MTKSILKDCIGKFFYEPSDDEYLLVVDVIDDETYKVYSYLYESIKIYNLSACEDLTFVSKKYINENINHCKNSSILKDLIKRTHNVGN